MALPVSLRSAHACRLRSAEAPLHDPKPGFAEMTSMATSIPTASWATLTVAVAHSQHRPRRRCHPFLFVFSMANRFISLVLSLDANDDGDPLSVCIDLLSNIPAEAQFDTDDFSSSSFSFHSCTNAMTGTRIRRLGLRCRAHGTGKRSAGGLYFGGASRGETRRTPTLSAREASAVG